MQHREKAGQLWQGGKSINKNGQTTVPFAGTKVSLRAAQASFLARSLHSVIRSLTSPLCVLCVLGSGHWSYGSIAQPLLREACVLPGHRKPIASGPTARPPGLLPPNKITQVFYYDCVGIKMNINQAASCFYLLLKKNIKISLQAPKSTVSTEHSVCYASHLVVSNNEQGLPGGSVVKNPPAMQEMHVRSLGWEDPLEKEMAKHSTILAWEILWTEELGGL